MRKPSGKEMLVAAAVLGIQLTAPVVLWAAPGGPAQFSGAIPVEDAIQDMEDPGRRGWQQPEKVVEHLGIRPGDTVADIGSGTGYFTLLMSGKTGKGGVVYAVEIDPALVSYLQKRSAREGAGNIRNVLARPDDPLLPKGAVDLAFMCNTYLFIDSRVQYLAKVREALKQGGRLAIVSYDNAGPQGPPPQIRLSREQTIREAEQAGFQLASEYVFLPYQYFLVFRKR